VHTRLATSAVQQSIPATDKRIVTWRDVHQTKRLEADVSLSMLITRVDGVEIDKSETQRTIRERDTIA
jgi:hypothetical protein